MRMEKLTTKFQLALQDAQSFAVGREQQFVEPIHLMEAMLVQENSTIAALFMRVGADANLIKRR